MGAELIFDYRSLVAHGEGGSGWNRSQAKTQRRDGPAGSAAARWVPPTPVIRALPGPTLSSVWRPQATDADAGADAGDGDGDGESVFGPWEGLEGTLGAAREREELLSGFAPGGVWDKHPPGPELAAALARAAGPDWRCAVGDRRGADRPAAGDGGAAVVGGRGDAGGDPGADPRRRPALPGPAPARGPARWVGRLPGRTRSPWRWRCRRPSADKTTRAAWELGARLPGVELLLRDGTLDVPRARLVTEVFAELSDEDCARAEELLLPELTAPPRKTYTQVERIATAIAAAVDPGLAERRRKAAEKHRSRVTVFRERAGHGRAVGPGPAGRRDAGRLRQPRRPRPAVQGLRARSRASGWTACGRRPTWTSSTASPPTIGSPAATSAPTPPPRPAPSAAPGDATAGSRPRRRRRRRGGGGPADGPGSGRVGLSLRRVRRPVRAPRRQRLSPTTKKIFFKKKKKFFDRAPANRATTNRATSWAMTSRATTSRAMIEYPATVVPARRVREAAASRPSARRRRRRRAAESAATGGTRPARTAIGAPAAAGGPQPTLAHLVFPLATLLGLAERPGEGHGLGTLDPALCRALAATAVRQPPHHRLRHSHQPRRHRRGPWPLVKYRKPSIHPTAPGARRAPRGAERSGINLTITAARLAATTPQRTGPPGPPGPPGPGTTGRAPHRLGARPAAAPGPARRPATGAAPGR